MPEETPPTEIVDAETGEIIEPAETSKARGRKARLTENTYNKIQQAIMSGVSDRVACNFVNISRTSFHNWIRQGEADLESGLDDTIYARFAEMVERSRAIPHVQAAAIIVKAMPEDPRLALEFLKARYPEEWKNSTKVDVSIRQADDAMLQILETEQLNAAKQLTTLDTYLEKARERAALPAPAEAEPGTGDEDGEDRARPGLPEPRTPDETGD